MPGLRSRRTLVAIGSVMLAAGSAGGLAAASIPDSAGVLHGCYANRGGNLRLIDSTSREQCRREETAVNWNQTGSKGDKGDPGAPGPTEGVAATAGPGTLPATLSSQFNSSITDHLGLTFTTTVKGKLYLWRFVTADMQCTSAAYVWWWIILDGSAVQSSAVLTEAGSGEFDNYTLAGVTDTAVDAGVHTMTVGAMCADGAAAAYGKTGLGQGIALVLGS